MRPVIACNEEQTAARLSINVPVTTPRAARWGEGLYPLLARCVFGVVFAGPLLVFRR